MNDSKEKGLHSKPDKKEKKKERAKKNETPLVKQGKAT